jgi:RNA polymerase sigma-70 factor (ECF subfamily)
LNESDAEILRRIGLRDRQAFDALFRRYASRLRARLQRIVQDPVAVEDLLQEAFFRVWTRADRYQGRGPVAAWLYRIASNLALNHLRTARRRRELPLEAPEADDSDEQMATLSSRIAESSMPGPEAQFEQAELRREVERLVRDLPESKRDVLRLVHGQDLSVDEAAVALGVPPGTVKSRLFYGRRALEQRLRDYLED